MSSVVSGDGVVRKAVTPSMRAAAVAHQLRRQPVRLHLTQGQRKAILRSTRSGAEKPAR